MEAIRELEASRDLWRSLPATGARNAQVACAWLQVGVMRRKAEGDKAAEAAYLEAINLYRPLTRAAGCTARELGEHGQACNNLANILFARGDNTEAARMYREAAAAGESLAVNFPADTTCRTLRLYPRLMLARIKARAGEVADAYREVCSLPRRAPDVKEASFRAAEMLMAIREDLLASTAPAAVKRGMASRIEETAIRLLISGPLPDGALEMPVFRPLAGHRDLEALRGKVIR
jgi:tetratricopeptide (TPR) repeat protein